MIYEAFRKSATLEYEKTKEMNLTFLDLFRTPNIRRNVLLMICNWSLTSVLFDGHIRNIENLQYSIYWTFTISSALELPSDLLSIWGLGMFSHKMSLITIFGQKHFRQKFHQKFDVFDEKNFICFYFGIKLQILKQNYLLNEG